MKRQYVRELAEGTRVDAAFVVSAREMRATRQGAAYLSLELSDRTGRMSGVWFRPGPHALTLPVGSVARVVGTVTTYRGTARISVDHLEEARSYDPEDMLASGPRDSDELVREFRKAATLVHDRELRAVVRAVFGDEVFFGRFTACPGGQSHHHAYRGGLMEHTIAVARICTLLSAQYDEVDGDLLLTAALLHDIGKVDELRYEATVEYTDEGRLVGHVILGERRLREAIQRAGVVIGDRKLTHLSHALLSHHGELEWGSPKRPSTIEALLLHHADNLDAKAAGFVEIMKGATSLDERWTDAHNLFRRPLFAPAAMQDERPHAAREDDQYARESA